MMLSDERWGTVSNPLVQNHHSVICRDHCVFLSIYLLSRDTFFLKRIKLIYKILRGNAPKKILKTEDDL